MDEKVDEYFKILHPEYETLTPGEQLRTMRDKSFIEDYIDEIDEMYTTTYLSRERKGENVNKQKIIATAVRLKKADKYFELLHPEYETLTPGEQLRTMRDKSFIEDHIDEIDEMYATYVSQAERKGEDINKKEILKGVIKGMQPRFSTQGIGKATKDAPTTTKKEAEQVENNENTIDNIKEGEEVGDDN